MLSRNGLIVDIARLNLPSTSSRQFDLPQLNPGQVERSFRKKWLSTDIDLGEDMALAGNILGQVGLALDMSGRHKYSLSLSTEEQKLLLNCVLKVAESLSEGGWSSRGFSPSGIVHSICSILGKIEVPKDDAEQLYEIVSVMRELPSASESHPFFDVILNVNELRTLFAHAVMPGLIKAMPDHVEDIAGWIRLGLTSDNDLQVRQSMSTLRSWMAITASAPDSIIPPPDDLVREIGVVIATRRKVALENALSAARWVFESGDTKHQEVISPASATGTPIPCGRIARRPRTRRRQPRSNAKISLRSSRQVDGTERIRRLTCNISMVGDSQGRSPAGSPARHQR
jgi:hypothetical protein